MSLVNKLERLADQSRSSTLRQVTTQLRRLLEGLEDLDSRPVGGGTINHLQIARHLARSVPGVFPEKAILRVDLVKRASGLQFSEALVREIARGARIISLVSRRPALEKALDDFKMRFRDLYEDHEVPLLEALDEEVGIPFQTYGTDAEEDRAVPSRRHRQLDRWLATKLGDALAAGRREIELAPAELERHLSANQAPVAPSYAAVISVGYACAGTQRVDRFDVLMKNVIRPAAAGLARFEHHLGRLEWNTDRPAQAAGPLPVDILHFPQGTLSSAMLQPRTDRASVSYMAGRPPTSDLCISPDDLLLSVKGGRIVVRSESLNREIVPRLSCQHNFPQNGVPFYRFLCSLQQPAGAVDRWEWGPLIVMPFLPRVRSGSVILSRARWTLGGDDLDSMRSRDAADREQWFTDWADRNGIPRYVYLLDGMRELLIDRQNQLSLSYVLRAATARRLTLVEMLPGPEQLALWGHEGRYLMEAVIPFEDGGPNQQIGRGRLAHQTQLPTVRWRQQPDDTPRNYPPGSRWLFVKVYCAPSIQDAILSDLIVPFAERSISSGLASRWFFVRYRDPGPHLRLRFLAGEHSMALLAQITQELATPQAQGIIKRVVIDTYEPEVTRYGGPAAIDHAEEFFWRDSEAIGAVLPGLKAVGSANPDSRWIAGLWNADLLVSAFRLTPMEQKTFVRALRDSTRIRFRTDDATSHELSYWARQNREALSAVARGDRSAVATLTITPLDTRQAHVRRIVDDLLRLEGEGQLLVRRSDLFMSLLHMSMNRLLPLDAPHWEAAVYELLDRTMQMRFARQEVQKP